MTVRPGLQLPGPFQEAGPRSSPGSSHPGQRAAFFFLLGLLGLSPAPAAEQATQAGKTPSPPTEPGDTQAPSLGIVDVTHRALSRGLETTAKGIDKFFATEEALEEATGSFVKLRLDNWWIEREGAKAVPDIRASLKLPRTERRFNLLIESNPEREERTEADLPDTPAERAEERDFALALEGLGEGKRWEYRPALGMKFTIPLDPFGRVRFIRKQKVGRWDSRLSNTLAWFRTEGVIGRIEHDFDRPLTESLLFRAGSFYRWSRDDELQSFEQRLSLFQTVKESRRIAYEAGARTNDDPKWGIKEYYARVRLRRRIHRKWLFAEIQPQVRFPRNEGFRHVWALLFRLEAIFGEKALYQPGEAPE